MTLAPVCANWFGQNRYQEAPSLLARREMIDLAWAVIRFGKITLMRDANFYTTLYCLLLGAILIAPLFPALGLRPLPAKTAFPARREMIALFFTIVLLPPISYALSKMGYGTLLLGPFILSSFSMFLTAIAGRHPFLYTAILCPLPVIGLYSLLYLDNSVRGKPIDFSQSLSSAALNVYISIFACILFCWLVSSLFLFLVWDKAERKIAINTGEV